MSARPLYVLGVRRSGTTLLRVMLDRSSELAIPDESYFIPQLAHRHHGAHSTPTRSSTTCAGCRRSREWGRHGRRGRAERLRPGMTPSAQAIGAIFEAYAGLHGARNAGATRRRSTCSTWSCSSVSSRCALRAPRPGRAGRRRSRFCAIPPGIMTEGWGHPQDAVGFAWQWRTEVEAAQALGARRRFRAVPRASLRGSRRWISSRRRSPGVRVRGSRVRAEHARLRRPARDSARKPHQQRLNQPSDRRRARLADASCRPDDVGGVRGDRGRSACRRLATRR